ncbi:hypothetical protein [Thalassobacillus devorans]|uniref:hypothetical protein n=1 Tax=Thalassobacillus devorans TaxID=279813 RepID=UPI001594D129|nr:hypothetical protein [Thalassobacillus devorans]
MEKKKRNLTLVAEGCHKKPYLTVDNRKLPVMNDQAQKYEVYLPCSCGTALA